MSDFESKVIGFQCHELQGIIPVNITDKTPIVHYLKCWPEPFKDIVNDKKLHEIRSVKDRIFQVGDYLVLCEFNPKTLEYSGRRICVEVTYITQPGEWGISEELCVMSINKSHFLSTNQIFELGANQIGRDALIKNG